jgi:hypothetical protein
MSRIMLFAAAVLAAGCAGFEGRGLVPGTSTLAEVNAVMGPAADKRRGVGGETVYYYPRLPWGYASYAARIGADGRLIALEQRLTPENVERVKVGATRGEEVLDLLGPPYEPMKQGRTGNDIWTYPMRAPGHPTPKWFLVTVSPDGLVREAYMIDDPNYNRHGVLSFP